MNKTALKRLGIILGSIAGGAYALFLLSPLIINPLISGVIPTVETEINKASGLVSNLEDVKFVTTPKFTAGIKVGKFAIETPDKAPVFSADDFQVKMSLLPLLAGKIRIDALQLKNADVNIKMNHAGELEIAKYFPETEKTDESKTAAEAAALPLGLKLSNHLPDIRVGGYNVTLTDGVNNYVISGNKTEITDFILDKHVKVKASGKMVLRGREQFNYDLKVFNKIMPDLNLNDLVTNPQTTEEPVQKAESVDVIGILDGLYKNNLTASAAADLTVEEEAIKGTADITNVSIINLPASSANLKFKGKTIDVTSDIYTAKNEVSKINGEIKMGKNPDIDMNIKSKVEIANILKIVKEAALIFDIKDLQTLSASGTLDADFNIKSDLKKVKSSGYLKVPSAKMYYGLYNIGVDNINADVSLANNNVNIKNIGFSVLNQPLKFYGTISEDAVSDLHLTADKLSLKGLLVALGQAALLKDNNVNSGTVSMIADITGKLDKINPVVKINLDNISIKSIPADTVLQAPATIVNITSDGKTFAGSASSTNIKAINPAATVSIPKLAANIKEEEIEITQTPVAIEKININVSGKIKNYLKEKMSIDFVTTGDIKSTLAGDINSVKQTLNLNYTTTAPSSIIIPMFDKSKLDFTGDIAITGSMANPVLKGAANVPTINIPEIPVSMTNMMVKLNGHILNGSATVEKFTSGGIEAENLSSDFSMKGENFYLKNLKGTAFNGKVSGNIIYNLTNAKTTIDFTGSGMNAEKAVYGGTGIKNALSGTLGFNTKLSMTAADYNDMMKSLKGNLNFEVKNGAFGSIGRIENYLQAENIINSTILKSTVSTISTAAGIADTAKFEYIEGTLSFSNGWAELKPVKSSGTLLAYYVKGKYNLLNGTAVLTILGRLDGTIVAKLGPVGELSASKLLSYIPKFGTSTANFVKTLTSSPDSEEIGSIPALTGENTTYKDFKVIHNGVVGKSSAIKSFKWLTDVDTSAIEVKTVKETLKDIKTSANEDITNTVKSVTDAVTTSKEQWNSTKDQLKNSAEELKNLFKF